VRVVREEIDELVAERGKRGASADARMIIDEEDELAQWLDLVRERLRELRQASLEAVPSIEEGRELLPNSGESRRRAPTRSANRTSGSSSPRCSVSQAVRRPDARSRSAYWARTVVLP